MTYNDAIELAGRAMEVAGVAIIVVGAVTATWRYLKLLEREGTTAKSLYRQFRTGVAMAILLGLEFLVAGDIIRTVVIEPNMQSVLVLGLIVLIRTFLSFELTLEIEGLWPWQRGNGNDPDEVQI
ncbi:MAG: DUF1622 domain-containing protein [Thermomicrobiales bacterium]